MMSRAVYSARAATNEAVRLQGWTSTQCHIGDWQPLLALVLFAGAPPGRCGGCEVTAAAGVGETDLEMIVITLCRCKGRSSTVD